MATEITDTGVPFSTDWVKFRISRPVADGDINFYIDDVLVATHTLDSAGGSLVPHITTIKEAGGNTFPLDIDLMKMRLGLAAPR
jgi:hypothetical protein